MLFACLGAIIAATQCAAQPPVTEILWPGRPASAFDLARDDARLQGEMTAWSLIEVTDPERGDVTRWAFTMKPGFGFNDLFWRHEIERPFDTLSLWVRNTGAPFTLSLKIADKGYAEYAPKPAPLAADGKWRRVDWPWEEFGVASWSKDPDGAFDWPARYVAVIAFDVKPEVECEVFLGEMSVQRPRPPPAGPAVDPREDAWYFADRSVIRYELAEER